MHTILGSTGQIGSHIAKALYLEYSQDIRLVSRQAQALHESDEVIQSDLCDKNACLHAIKGSTIVYFALGLPLNTALWEKHFPVMMRNVIDACEVHGAKLVFFDNTYMYSPSQSELRESSPFLPNGPKGKVRAEMANMVLKAIEQQRIQALIARAPEFYGPGKTQSFTNFLVLNACRKNHTARVFVSDKTLRTLIYSEDASRATALLANTEDAFNQTWHLPCDDDRMSYQEIIAFASEILKRQCHYKVMPRYLLSLLQYIKPQIKETKELWPRYGIDNLFISDKFKQRFPDFTITSYKEGITRTVKAK